MEVIGQFGNAKPAHFAKFTVEHCPGFPSLTQQVRPPATSNSASIGGRSSSSMPQAGMATLFIETIPADAQVFLDETYVGATNQGPVVLPALTPTEYDVSVTKSGFRPWKRTLDLYSGERRTLRVRLLEANLFELTGVWENLAEPFIAYVFEQQGLQVMIVELTTSILGTVVTAEGEGELHGQQLEMTYRTMLETNRKIAALLSEDGQRLVGTFHDASTRIPVVFSLMRTDDPPPVLSSSSSADFKAIQSFGH